MLNLPGGFNTIPNFIRAFANGIIGELFVFNPWDFDEDVDAVEKRAAEPLLVARYFAGGAFAVFNRVSQNSRRGMDS
jgi:hypothetical protein